MPKWTALLDDRLYRILTVGTQLTKPPSNYTITISNDPSKISPINPLGDVLNFKEISSGVSFSIEVGRLRSSKCEDVIVNNPINPNHHQATTFDKDTYRVIKFHENISTTAGYRVLLINDNIGAGPGPIVDTTGQVLVLVTPTNTYNVDAGVPKIPPNTDQFRKESLK